MRGVIWYQGESNVIGNDAPSSYIDKMRALAGGWRKAFKQDDLSFYSGPMYKSMEISGKKIVLSFDHVGGGLTTLDGEAPTHFAIAGADNKFVPAEATIKGDTIEAASPDVAMPGRGALRVARDGNQQFRQQRGTAGGAVPHGSMVMSVRVLSRIE